ELGVLALYVTHDQEEPMSVSDRIGVFQNGRLMQVGAPEAIYRDPTTLFVADFIGKINFFPGEVRRDGSVQLAGGFVTAPIKRHPLTPEEATTYAVSGDAVVAVRPEHLVISEVTHPLVPAPNAAT